MSIIDIENHLKIETKYFNENFNINNNWLITSILGFDPKLFENVKKLVKKHKLNNPNYKWIVYSNKKIRGFYFLEIWSQKEIKSKTKQKIYGKNYLKMY